MGDPSKVVQLQSPEREGAPPQGQKTAESPAQDTTSKNNHAPMGDDGRFFSQLMQIGSWRGTRGEVAIGVSISALALAVVGLSAYMFSAPWTNDGRIAAAIDARAAATETVFDEKIAAASNEAIARVDAISSDVAALDGLLDKLTTDGRTMSGRLDSIEADMQDGQADIMGAVAEFRADLRELRATIEDGDATASNRIAKLEKRWSAINQPTSSSAHAVSEQATAAIPLQALPFQPVSIDVWGGSLQLAVRRGPETRFLVKGESLDGWRVETIAHNNATLRAPNGGELNLAYSAGRFSSAPAILPMLTVAATPTDARIRIMNIKPVYHPAMPLAPGAYDIEITRDGHAPVRRWIRLDESNRTLTVTLSLLN